MAQRAWTFSGRKSEWPVAAAWEIWQAQPVCACQVREDGYLGLTHRVCAGDWILKVPTEPDAMGSAAYEYIIMGDMEFRRRYQRRNDMEAIIEESTEPAAIIPFVRRD